MARKTYDAIIVGARVAGAATALLLARAGARVLIVDRDPAIGDTLSTHALMRPAVGLLERWGLLDGLVAAGTPWVRQAHFHYGSDRITVPVKRIDRAEGLLAPRRRLLDPTILAAAVAAGAELALGTTVEGCLRAGNRIVGAVLRRPDGERCTLQADLVVGADGRMSRIAEMVGARPLILSTERTATLYGYVPNIPNEGYRWFFGQEASAGVIPTNDGLHCVFAACRPADYSAHFADARNGMAAILRGFDPALAQRVLQAPSGHLRRFLGAPGHMRKRAGEGWALVGDAACFKDPATAHGITDALLDADALSRSLLRDGTPDRYGCERHEQSRPLFEVTQKIASFDWDFDALRTLHDRLNACMKSEQRALLDPDPALRLRRDAGAGPPRLSPAPHAASPHPAGMAATPASHPPGHALPEAPRPL
ncbi:NAD(P)/FAD-dependent oxidoreductase [Rhodobacter sp. CZR27]|uniref:NAD(P)/FAD-dependent oxidoreductase n=1 Tax=Rhodobacter sp. CZR27 TaxID=2033869 RepID=UPI000BBEB44F|nr:FAD-dependent monooxygenase [Rhodobacter sp. CZR27]